MKSVTKLVLTAAILSPLAASAQFITISSPNVTTNTPNADIFHDTVIRMWQDVDNLKTPEPNGVPGDLDLSVESSFWWDDTNSVFSDVSGTTQFIEIGVEPFFKLANAGAPASFGIGYFGNESDDDNELYVAGYNNALKTLTDTDDTNITYESPDGYKLFDYDTDDPNSPDGPPMSYTIALDQGVNEAYIQFTHWNRNPLWPDSAVQDEPQRFKFWAGYDGNGTATGEYLIAVSDRDFGFDQDRDDGFFYLSGDIVPVPEPSQIAALALLGLGGLLIVRRRFRNKQ